MQQATPAQAGGNSLTTNIHGRVNRRLASRRISERMTLRKYKKWKRVHPKNGRRKASHKVLTHFLHDPSCANCNRMTNKNATDVRTDLRCAEMGWLTPNVGRRYRSGLHGSQRAQRIKTETSVRRGGTRLNVHMAEWL